GAITCLNSPWGSTLVAVDRPQRLEPHCACTVTTERTIQRREPEWRQGFSSSMTGSIVGIYSARSYAPITISLAVAFLQKPVKADELTATIQGVLGKQG